MHTGLLFLYILYLKKEIEKWMGVEIFIDRNDLKRKDAEST